MQEQTAVHNTFVIEHSYPKPPERVFAAFADAARKRRWFAEGDGHELEDFRSDFRVDGMEVNRYRMKAGTPVEGARISSEGRFQDIIPNRRIVSAMTMDMNDKRISASLVTIEFLATKEGTDLICTHQGTYLDWPIGAQVLEAGWRSLMVESLSGELAR